MLDVLVGLLIASGRAWVPASKVDASAVAELEAAGLVVLWDRARDGRRLTEPRWTLTPWGEWQAGVHLAERWVVAKPGAPEGPTLKLDGRRKPDGKARARRKATGPKAEPTPPSLYEEPRWELGRYDAGRSRSPVVLPRRHRECRLGMPELVPAPVDQPQEQVQAIHAESGESLTLFAQRFPVLMDRRAKRKRA